MYLSKFQATYPVGVAAQVIPTTDLYFLNACRALVGGVWHKRPIKREGANSFSCGSSLIVCRRDEDTVVDQLLARQNIRLFYIIDDDLWAAEKDPTLPDAYQKRLAHLREGQHRRLAERAETIIVSSPSLAAIYQQRGHKVEYLPPYWSDRFAPLHHFDMLAEGAPLEIGYLGTASHRADREFVMGVFEKLLTSNAHVRLTMVGASELPDGLQGHPKLRIIKPLPWVRHRRRLSRLRFHLLLYPTLPTPFNASRSCNKLIEHAVSGGIGLYSDNWGYAALVADQSLGLVLKNETALWARTIADCTQNLTRNQADGVNRKVADINGAAGAAQKRFWAQLFPDLDEKNSKREDLFILKEN